MATEQRWYEVNKEAGVIYVYDAPTAAAATSVSILFDKRELAYYRKTFKLSKVWAADESLPL